MLPDERRDTQQARAVAKTVLFVYFSLAKIATFWFRWSVAFGLPLFARAFLSPAVFIGGHQCQWARDDWYTATRDLAARLYKNPSSANAAHQ